MSMRTYVPLENPGPIPCRTRGKDPNDYFRVKPSPDKPSVAHHRWIFEHFFGPIPEGMRVCHTCDNPPCYEITHLWLGTDKDNAQDKVAKGRACTSPGGLAARR